jgi:hypothetical protein
LLNKQDQIIEELYQKLFNAVPEDACPANVVVALGMLLQEYTLVFSGQCEAFNDYEEDCGDDPEEPGSSFANGKNSHLN